MCCSEIISRFEASQQETAEEANYRQQMHKYDKNDGRSLFLYALVIRP